MTKTRLTIICLLTVLLQSCGNIMPPEFAGINAIDVTEIRLSQITVRVNVTVYNPNRHRITVKNADIDVAMRDIRAGKLLIGEPITVDARSHANCDFTLKLSTAETFRAGISAADELFAKNGEIKFTGTAEGEYGIFKRKLDIDTTVKIGDIVSGTKPQQHDL
ncbi:MAG: LEA type 2 family protein [Bacteroidales bacterium]|nr:LEA type 2 family protein [Bacteroidales bacterium]